MASLIKDFFESLRTKEGQRGFTTALWLVVTVLTAYSWFFGIQFQMPSNTYWISPETNKPVLGFPSYENPDYKFYVTSIGEFAGSVSIKVEQTNGWQYSGTFYKGDVVSFGEYRVLIKEINMDRDKPVNLESSRLIDARPLLILSFILLILVVYSGRPTSKRKSTR